MQILIRSGVLVLLGAFSVQAQGSTGPGGWALSFGVGPTTIEDEDAPGDQFDGSATGWNLEIEYRFGRFVAIGAARTAFGEDTQFFNGAETTIEVDGSGFFLRGYLPVNDRLTFSLRYGNTFYDADLEPGGSGFDRAKDFGAAADISFNDSLALRLETRLLDGDRKEEGSITTVGLRWRF